MTTLHAAQAYLHQHLQRVGNRPVAYFNPNNEQLNSLPRIFGFNNGGSQNWLRALLLAQDGTYLGGHVCSDEGYMPFDLGILEGTREDRHKGDFQKHYPGGYVMEWVPSENIKDHEGLNKAIALNQLSKTITSKEDSHDD